MKMGTVDVERYTGPCLITTAVRPKPKPRPGVASDTACSTSTVADCDNKHASANANSNGGLAHHHHHYPQLPINDPRNWAGAPLLSMAASIRKTKNGGGGGVGVGVGGGCGVNKNWHPPPVYLPAPMMHPANAVSMEGYAPHSSHLQGAPLIRVPRQQQQQQQSYHKKNMSAGVHGASSAVAPRRPIVYHHPTMALTSTAPPSPLPAIVSQRCPTAASEVTSACENGDAGSSSGCPSSSSDTCSVTSDEGLASGGSDSSLPRIIKPRKRRKKPGQEASSLSLHPQRLAKGLLNGGSHDFAGTSALSQLDDLLSNQVDSLAELFRHTSLSSSKTNSAGSSSSSSSNSSSCSSASSSCTASSSAISSSTADNGVLPSAQSPPLWRAQSCGEEDIWSSGCWHSLSPVWSPSGSGNPSPSSSSSCWPDQRVIRRPDHHRSGHYQPPPPSSSVPFLDLPSSSFLNAAMPQLVQHRQSQHYLLEGQEQQQQQQQQTNDLQLQLDSPPPLGHYLQVSSQLIASPFNGHRDIEIRFFSSTGQPNATATTEELGRVVKPEQQHNNNCEQRSVSSPDFPR